MKKAYLSNSRAKVLLRCPHAWYLHRQGWRLRKVSDPLRIGSMFHEYLEHGTLPEDVDSDTVLLLSSMHAEWYEVEHATVLKREHPFAISITDAKGAGNTGLGYNVREGDSGSNVFTGKIDGIGLNEIVEYKTTSYTEEQFEQHIDMDFQPIGYCVAMDSDVVQYEVVRRRTPSMPKWNKNGTLSKAKCDTSARAWRLAVETDPRWAGTDEQVAIRDKAVRPYSWSFTRYITPQEKLIFLNHIMHCFSVYRERERRPHAEARAFSAHCDWCEYRHVCRNPDPWLFEELFTREEFQQVPHEVTQ